MEGKKGSYHHILKYTGIFGGIQIINILFALIRNKFVALISALKEWDLFRFSIPP